MEFDEDDVLEVLRIVDDGGELDSFMDFLRMLERTRYGLVMGSVVTPMAPQSEIILVGDKSEAGDDPGLPVLVGG
jgi:hypothetical protein